MNGEIPLPASPDGEPRRPLLAGSLGHLSVPDLLQTAESSRRSGTISLANGSRRGTLWLRGGRVVDAEVQGGPRGEEAVYEIALWDEGSFEADFTPVAVPERIFSPTGALLLEAMRRHDEVQRGAPPPHAAIPDPPPPPPRPLLTLHRALTLANVASSYAGGLLEPALVAARLEESRQGALREHPVLAAFAVGPDGAVVARPDPPDPDLLVPAVARWLILLFAALERALPGRFSLQRLRTVTEAVQEDLAALGFYRHLGLAPSPAAPGPSSSSPAAPTDEVAHARP